MNKFQRFSAGAAAALTAALLAAAPLSAASYDWNTASDVSAVRAREDDATYSVSIAADPTDAANRALLISKTEVSDLPSDTLLDLGKLTEKTTVSLRFLVSEAATGVLALTEGDVQSNAAQMAVRIVFRDNGNIGVISGAAEEVIGTYEAGKWVSLSLEVDPSAKTFDVSLNGETKLTGAAFCTKYTGEGPVTTLAACVMKKYAADLYLDDVSAGSAAAVVTEAPVTEAPATEAPVTTPTVSEKPSAPATADVSAAVMIAAAAAASAAVVLRKKK